MTIQHDFLTERDLLDLENPWRVVLRENLDEVSLARTTQLFGDALAFDDETGGDAAQLNAALRRLDFLEVLDDLEDLDD